MTGAEWTWDPRRSSSYRSRDGGTWGHLPLLLTATRLVTKANPDLSHAARIRRSGMLKIASVASAFGMFLASTPIDDATPGAAHRIITAEGVRTVWSGTPERPGPWAYPPAGAMVEGAGRLLLTLVLHEGRVRGGEYVQADTDGGFILATLFGGPIGDEA